MSDNPALIDSGNAFDSGGSGRDSGPRDGRRGYRSVRRLLDRYELHVLEDPDALAIADGVDALSRAELWIAAGIAATEIRSAAGSERQVVVVHLPGSTVWLVMFLAVLRAGHVPATVSLAATVEDLLHVLDVVEPAMVISTTHGSERSPDQAALEAASKATGVAVARAGGTVLQSLDEIGGSPGAACRPGDADYVAFLLRKAGPPVVMGHTEDSLAADCKGVADRFSLNEHTPVYMPDPHGHHKKMICAACRSVFVGAPLILQYGWN